MPDYTEQRVGTTLVYRCEHCACLLKPHALDVLHHLDRAHGIRVGE